MNAFPLSIGGNFAFYDRSRETAILPVNQTTNGKIILMLGLKKINLKCMKII